MANRMQLFAAPDLKHFPGHSARRLGVRKEPLAVLRTEKSVFSVVHTIGAGRGVTWTPARHGAGEGTDPVQ